MGSVVLDKELENTDSELINISSFGSGIYFVQIFFENNFSVIKKIIKK